MTETEGWVIEGRAPKAGVFRLLGYKGGALFFKTRQEAREFIRQWREDTKDKAPLRASRAELHVRAPKAGE